MHLALLGLNYKSAPVEIREKLSIPVHKLPEAISCIEEMEGVSECLILSTCNRTEIYTCADSRQYDTVVPEFINKFCGITPEDFMPHMYRSSGHKAAEHLFRVSTGLDSMVLGETQILGQIKDAYTAARLEGSTGQVLNMLFQQAITIGKRARTETEISRGTFSAGSAAVQLARSIFEDLHNRNVLMIGVGKMAKSAISHLTSAGVNKIEVCNRTYEKAVCMAEEIGGQSVKLEDMNQALERADIVITSTSTEQFVITREMLSPIIRRRRGKPIFLIDIAVPRDIEESVSELENVFLYNIDDLKAVVEASNNERLAEVKQVENIIGEELEEFMCNFRKLDAVPVIIALREKFEDIRLAEVELLNRKLQHLSPEDVSAINAATRSIVSKICHQPMLQIKDYAQSESLSKLDVIRETFGLDDNKQTDPSFGGNRCKIPEQHQNKRVAPADHILSRGRKFASQ